MDAAIKLDHSLVAVEAEHTLHAMVELRAPEAAGADRPRCGWRWSSTVPGRWRARSWRR